MDVIKKIVEKLYPELKSGLHLPQIGRVVQISDAPDNAQIVTMARPFYAVDIQPLDEHGQDLGDIFKDIPLALPASGGGRGFFAYPSVGTLVEYTFAFGRPDKPYIRCILPLEQPMPPLNTNESRWQQSDHIYQGYDQAGNWHRSTLQNIYDNAGQLRECRAQLQQKLIAKKTWLGSESENVLKILSDALETISSAFEVIAAHVHPGHYSPATNASSIKKKGAQVDEIKSSRLDPLI